MTNKLMLELRQLNFLAKRAAERGDKTEADRLRATASGLSDTRINPDGLSSDELRSKYAAAVLDETGAAIRIDQGSPEYRKAFNHYLLTGEWNEKRDVQVGTTSLTFSQLTQGGPLVPIDTEEELTEAIAQTDPLLSDEVVDFKMSDTPYKLQTKVLRGIDLTTVKAQNIAETNQQQPQAFTFAAAKTLRGNIGYRFSLAASIEAEQDIEDWLSIYVRTAGVAFARQLGVDAAIGNGSLNTPSGLFPFLGPAVTTVGTGSAPVGGQSPPNITYADLNNLYFSVDRAYRNQPKCGWLCADAVYKKIRNAADNFGQPLLRMIDDKEMLLGKPIHVSPSMSNALSSEGSGVLAFGDLSHMKVRVSKPWIQRQINQAGVGDITKGECLYVTRVKMDSVYLDPSNGGTPAIVWASVHP